MNNKEGEKATQLRVFPQSIHSLCLYFLVMMVISAFTELEMEQIFVKRILILQ